MTVEEADGPPTRRSWGKLGDAEEWLDFIVTDESGVALVKTGGLPKMLVRHDVEQGSGILAEPTDAVRAFLESQGLSPSGLVFNRRLRVREACIPIGGEVVVFGSATCSMDVTPAASYRDAARRMTFADVVGADLVVSDDPKLR